MNSCRLFGFAIALAVPAMARETLSPVLKALVSRSVAVLGQVIENERGANALRKTETIRRKMASLRGKSIQARHSALRRLSREMASLSSRERRDLAHSFTLMLELMNACENAYRTFRHPRTGLREDSVRSSSDIVYVLTAHPSEARAPENTSVFHQIQGVLVQALQGRFETHEEHLRFLLEIAWHTPTSPHKRPSVEDEARHIYSLLLRPTNLDTLLETSEEIAPVHIRSWVGGDKDGNPRVDHRTLRQSLQLSRDYLVEIALRGASIPNAALAGMFRSLRLIRAGDGARVREARDRLARIAKQQRRHLGAAEPGIVQAERIFRLFPALVVPLELRESAEQLHEPAIRLMLEEIAQIAKGGDPLWYARGLIISMTSTAEDIRRGLSLVKSSVRDARFPVIPLFEQRAALEKGPKIIMELLKERSFREQVRSFWNSTVEVMLGYSDSAKEIGSLKSRLLIAKAVRKIDAVVRHHGCVPIFFHGSGGSVDRGGGSIDEQTAWWPRSALSVFKATIQGEMVERTFASPEIVRSQFERIAEHARRVTEGRPSLRGNQGNTLPISAKRAVVEFSNRASQAYRSRIADSDFTLVTRKATLYSYLDALRLGSRPTRRKRNVSGMKATEGLRAIPWVLCWTQTRALFPAWWGIGSAWKSATSSERRFLTDVFEKDPFFRSFVKLLGFTLSKVDLPVWRLYLEGSDLPRRIIMNTMNAFDSEFKEACRFVRSVSGQQQMLWFRPWLATSIELRSPMIHPLNILQIAAMKTKDPVLLRVTVTGIASGMMTTG